MRLCLAIFAAAMFVHTHAAEAQLLFGSRLGEAHYQGDDTKIISRIGAEMLRDAPDGESRPWSNPQTGHGGTITMIRSYQRAGMPCRDARLSSDVGQRSVVYVLPVCRVADGTWKLASR